MNHRWITHHKRVRGDIEVNPRIRSDQDMVSNLDATNDNRSSSDPHRIPYDWRPATRPTIRLPNGYVVRDVAVPPKRRPLIDHYATMMPDIQPSPDLRADRNLEPISPTAPRHQKSSEETNRMYPATPSRSAEIDQVPKTR